MERAVPMGGAAATLGTAETLLPTVTRDCANQTAGLTTQSGLTIDAAEPSGAPPAAMAAAAALTAGAATQKTTASVYNAGTAAGLVPSPIPATQPPAPSLIMSLPELISNCKN